MIEEDDIDQHCPGKGLPHSFPVLLEEGEDITIEDIKRMVDKATNLDKDEKDCKQLKRNCTNWTKSFRNFPDDKIVRRR